jgi:hypothetical protein
LQNFDIIGCTGKLDADEWKTDTHWKQITIFGKLRYRLAKADTGDLVRVAVITLSYKAKGDNWFTELEKR